MSQPMTRRRGTIVFNEHEPAKRWAAADPDPQGPKGFQASCYRALCLSSDGVSKLKAIRAGLAAERKQKASGE